MALRAGINPATRPTKMSIVSAAMASGKPTSGLRKKVSSSPFPAARDASTAMSTTYQPMVPNASPIKPAIVVKKTDSVKS